MLIDRHGFVYTASVPWPDEIVATSNWHHGIKIFDNWLRDHVGTRLSDWAWTDSGNSLNVGVAFRWDQDRLLFVMIWS
jgi:hypothetical protein